MHRKTIDVWVGLFVLLGLAALLKIQTDGKDLLGLTVRVTEEMKAGAVKGVLLQGYNAIPDCSYTSFGASQLYEEQSGLVLVAVLLVGS